MPKRKTIIRIGTSNVTLPCPRYQFPGPYQDKSRLCYYASLFNSVEVNSTFYKLPRPATLERWADEVPRDFRFTLKLWKEVTHCKGLPDAQEAVNRFMETAENIGAKKGCLLIQFPASITAHFLKDAARVLEQLEEHDPDRSWRKAVEFRHNSWYTEPVHQMLSLHDAALVLHDLPKSKPDWEEGDASFEYIRLHGPTGNYGGSYHPEFLEGLAEDINRWQKRGKDVYVYFNNTKGAAYENAVMLQQLVR